MIDIARKPAAQDLIDARALLVAAFDDDPFYAWFAPGAASRPRVVGAAMQISLVGCQVVLERDEQGHAAGVMAWHDPELGPVGGATAGAYATMAAHGIHHPVRSMRAGSVWEEIKRRRPERASPHIVLELFAVDARLRGRGLGAKLLRALLARADERAWVVHLETTRPGNVALYERFGFALVGDPIVRGGSPPAFTMRRAARTEAVATAG